MKEIKAWGVTNMGGKNFDFQKAFVNRLPIFYTKKKAEKEKTRLDAEIPPTGKFKRQVISVRINPINNKI